VVEPQWADALRGELAWLADGLGAARDAEVLLDRLHRSLDALPPELVLGPVRARIDQSVGGNLTAAADESVQTLRTERYLALVDRLVSAAWDPMTTEAAEEPAGTLVPRLVAATWERLAKAAGRVGSKRATDADWHRARIAAKQVRYVSEAVTPLFGRPAKTLAERAEAIQELLGEHQDAVVACAELRRLATGARVGGVGFTLGLLYSVEMAAIERTRREFPALWAETARSKYRKWLPG
jgi:CHAD domain-containing protein